MSGHCRNIVNELDGTSSMYKLYMNELGGTSSMYRLYMIDV